MKMYFLPLMLAALGFGGQMQRVPPPEALDGLDPVMLIQGKEVQGKGTFSTIRGDFNYLFATAENKATFDRDPGKYEIQLGGLCARMGGTTGGNPSDFLVHDGKIYIFGSDECHNRFKTAPAKYLPPTRAPLPAASDAVARGKQLLSAAARAMGDVKKLDSLTSYAETISQVQQRSQGEVTITTKTLWSFPNSARRDRTMALMGKTMASATVMAPAGMWFVGNGGQAYPMLSAARSSLDLDFGRHPVALLRLRQAPGTRIGAVGATTVEGTRVRQVRVVRGGLDATIGLDDQDRIHSVLFHARNMDGEYGQYVVLYSDIRDVNGLRLPFTARALFRGEPEASQSWTVQSVDLNPAADAGLFAPTKVTKP
jgi:YHS domain-containing protein